MWSAAMALPDSEIHVWRVRLDAAAPPRDPCGSVYLDHAPGKEGDTALSYSCLSPDEIVRAGRYRFERDRRRYTLTRSALRGILGSYMALSPRLCAALPQSGADPRDLLFRYNEYGKPYLDGAPLRFNVSHSNDLALIAVVRTGEIGVDVERIRADYLTDNIASRFFSVAEAGSLAKMSDDVRGLAFFRCWTRKEACVKAHGRGLSVSLNTFDVPTDPAPIEEFVSVRMTGVEWMLRDIGVEDGYAASVVVCPGTYELRLLDW